MGQHASRHRPGHSECGIQSLDGLTMKFLQNPFNANKSNTPAPGNLAPDRVLGCRLGLA